jgi:hypothetical protein
VSGRKAPVLFLVEKRLGIAIDEGLDHARSGSPEEERQGSATPPDKVAGGKIRASWR